MAKTLSKQFILKQEALLKKQEEKIKKQIETLRKEDPFADPEHASDNAAVDTDVREQVGHETIEAQVKDLERKLTAIQTAIKNIEKKTYGICERCHKKIPLARLNLIPEASYCVSCEQRLRS